ncbi:MAG: sigma-70 family RNA polymerase sigma factor [Bacteroidia bacterium]
MDRKRRGIGVEDAFWVHWGEHEPFLLRLCMGWLRGTPLDAQEVLSSGMLKAWDAAQNTTEEIGNYKAWFAKVLRNHCIDQQRKLARDLQVWVGADLQVPVIDRQPGTQLPSPEAMLLRDESYHWLIAGMEVLPERLREVMILRATQDMAYDEIGRRLHISGDNARKRVQLARERLRRHAPAPGTEVPEHEQEVTEAILAQERLDLGQAPCHVEPVAMCIDGVLLEVAVYHRFRPSRLQQKADTVARYLERHDAGWRKECEYIQLLWALGDGLGAMARMASARLRHPEVAELVVAQLRMLASIGAWRRGWGGGWRGAGERGGCGDPWPVARLLGDEHWRICGGHEGVRGIDGGIEMAIADDGGDRGRGHAGRQGGSAGMAQFASDGPGGVDGGVGDGDCCGTA